MNKLFFILISGFVLIGCNLIEEVPPTDTETSIKYEAVWQAANPAKLQFESVQQKYKLLGTLHGHKDDLVSSVSFSSSGLVLASGSNDGYINIWDVRTGELLQTLEGHKDNVHSVAFAPDSDMLASASWDSTVKIWDARRGDLLNTLEGHLGAVHSVAFAPDGATLASGGMFNTIKIWGVRNGKLKRVLKGRNDYFLWDRLLHKLGFLSPYGAHSVSLAPDGNTLVAGGYNSYSAEIWDVNSGKLLQELDAHTSYLQTVIFAPNGKILASGSSDNTIKIWDASSGELLQTLEGHAADISSVVFTPNSNAIVSSDHDGNIYLWDASSGELLRTLGSHGSGIHSIALSPDGKTLASAGGNEIIKLWRVPSAIEVDNWKNFVAEYKNGHAGLTELAELVITYPYLAPQYKELEDYQSALSLLRTAVDKNKAVNDYIAQRLRHYYENDAMFEKPEQRTRKTLGFTAQYLEEAMWLAYGAPQIEVGDKRKYDSEQELFHLQLQSQYPQFSQAIAVAMPPDAARAFAQDSSAAQVQVSFSISSKSIDLTEVELTFQENTYKGTPSSADSEFAWHLPTVIPEVIVAAKTTADPELAQAVTELPAAAPDSRAWLLAIGVEDYMVAPDVPYADNSLELMIKVLAKRFGIPESNRVVLQGEQASGTFIRGNILNTLGRLGPEDKLYFYYSGHGMPGRKGDQLYLAPRDIVVAAFEDEAFAFANLLGEIQQARVGQVVAFLDTCFSGKAGADELVFQGVAPITESAEQQLPDKMTVFYAGTGAQFANSYDDKGHRLFSYFLAQGLVDGLGTVEDLERYVSANVAQQSRAKGVSYEQTPFVDGRGGQL